MIPDPAAIRKIVSDALEEDVGHLDMTTHALIDDALQADARIFVKEDGVLAGVIVAEAVFQDINPNIKLQRLKQDGEVLKKGDEVLKIHARARELLIGERVALNFLQRLSGIATETARFVAEAGNSKILDTRKTTPGLRVLEKYAVRCGGGENHRMGLYDEFLIKDNHLALLKGKMDLACAVEQARAFNHRAKLTVEADTLEQVAELIDLNVDQILLDNMSEAQMAEAVRMVAGRCKIEASGNMELSRIRAVAETGVDYISVGALTHSVRALDFSMEIVKSGKID
ncbi:MAG: carboxylating nicotinate-nucleotide diphosphorylase [Verrucomicrobiota bacterium]